MEKETKDVGSREAPFVNSLLLWSDIGNKLVQVSVLTVQVFLFLVCQIFNEILALEICVWAAVKIKSSV